VHARTGALGTAALLASAFLLSLLAVRGISAREEAEPAIISVPAGANLQQALDQAKPGDTLVLEAGATYRGNFVLRAKEGEGTITLITSAYRSLPPEDWRVSPEHAVLMPKLVTPGDPVIRTEDGAHHYRFVGIEFHPAPGVYVSDVITLGSTSAKVVEQLPHDIEFDRVYIHGDPDKGSKRGIALNARYTAIKNSHFADFKSDFQDAQAIAGWNGSGPYFLLNNRLEASGMSVLFGGAAPAIPYLIPADIVFWNNYVTRPLSWKGRWRVKNLFELKNARNVDIRYNVFENNWVGAQNGTAILFTVRTCEAGDYPWAVVQDVTFRYNVVRNSEGGAFVVLGRDDERSGCRTPGTGTVTTRGTEVSGQGTKFVSELQPGLKILVNNVSRTIKEVRADTLLVLTSAFPQDITTPAKFASFVPLAGQTSNIVIRDNLLEGIRPFDGSRQGSLFAVYSGARDIVIDHNTGFQGQCIIVADGAPSSGVIFRDNISPHNAYGIFGSDKGVGRTAIDYYFPGGIFTGNVITGAGDSARLYPPGNFFPASLEAVGFTDLAARDYALATNSPYKGVASDGTDPGADMASIRRVLEHAVAGTLNPDLLAQFASRPALPKLRLVSGALPRNTR